MPECCRAIGFEYFRFLTESVDPCASPAREGAEVETLHLFDHMFKLVSDHLDWSENERAMHRDMTATAVELLDASGATRVRPSTRVPLRR